MTDHFAQAHLKNLPLFAGLTAAQVTLLAEITRVHRLEPGALALQEGHPSLGMMIFVSGRGIFTRRSPTGVEEQVGSVQAGQYLNEASLYAPRIEPVSVRIVASTLVLLIARDAFLNLISRYPDLRANLRALAMPSVVKTNAPQETPRPSLAPAPPRADPRVPMRTAPPANVVNAYGATPATQLATAPIMTQPPEPLRTTGATLFNGQRPGETVVFVFRRHWWAFGRHLWIPVVVGIALFAFAAYSAISSAVVGLTISVLGLVVPGLITFYLYHEWQNDSIILTEERIVRVWIHLISFQNSLSETPLDRILEISTVQPPGDPFARLFNYSTLHVRTAGSGGNFDLDLIADTHNVQKLIFAQKDHYSQHMVRQQKASMAREIQSALHEKSANSAPPDAQSAVPRAGQPAMPASNIVADDVKHGLPFIRTRFRTATGEIVYRRHSTIWLRLVFVPSIFLVAGVIMLTAGVFAPALPFPNIIVIAGAMVVLILGSILFYLGDWDWRNDLLIFGDGLVTLVHKRPLWLQNQVERIRIAQIDNVSSDVNGFINNILDRGEVRISLVGSPANESKVFDNVHDPQSIQAELSSQLEKIKVAQQQQAVDQQKQVMLDYLAAYHQVNQPTGSIGTAASAQTPGMTFTRPNIDEPTPPAPPSGDNVRPPRVPRPNNRG